MAYLSIVIPKADMATENAWMKENIDPEGGEYTFTNVFVSGEAEFSFASGDFTDDEIALLESHFETYYEGEITIADEVISQGETEIGNTQFVEPDAYADGEDPLFVDGNKMYQTIQLPTVSSGMLLIIDSEDDTLKQVSSSSIIR
jgi:hypothetical protein